MKVITKYFLCVSGHCVLQGGFTHKPLRLVGHTVIYGPLIDHAIIVHVLTERYNNVSYLVQGITA